jgi:hypothetical protein
MKERRIAKKELGDTHTTFPVKSVSALHTESERTDEYGAAVYKEEKLRY